MKPALQMPATQFSFCIALVAGSHPEQALLHFRPIWQGK